MKALFIIGLFIINDAFADFILEAKCFEDEHTGIILTYNEEGKPLVVKKCANPQIAELFYWRIRQTIPTKNGNKWIAKCFVSANSPMESTNIPSIPCSQARKIVDLYNRD